MPVAELLNRWQTEVVGSSRWRELPVEQRAKARRQFFKLYEADPEYRGLAQAEPKKAARFKVLFLGKDSVPEPEKRGILEQAKLGVLPQQIKQTGEALRRAVDPQRGVAERGLAVLEAADPVLRPFSAGLAAVGGLLEPAVRGTTKTGLAAVVEPAQLAAKRAAEVFAAPNLTEAAKAFPSARLIPESLHETNPILAAALGVALDIFADPATWLGLGAKRAADVVRKAAKARGVTVPANEIKAVEKTVARLTEAEKRALATRRTAPVPVPREAPIPLPVTGEAEAIAARRATQIAPREARIPSLAEAEQQAIAQRRAVPRGTIVEEAARPALPSRARPVVEASAQVKQNPALLKDVPGVEVLPDGAIARIPQKAADIIDEATVLGDDIAEGLKGKAKLKRDRVFFSPFRYASRVASRHPSFNRVWGDASRAVFRMEQDLDLLQRGVVEAFDSLVSRSARGVGKLRLPLVRAVRTARDDFARIVKARMKGEAQRLSPVDLEVNQRIGEITDNMANLLENTYGIKISPEARATYFPSIGIGDWVVHVKKTGMSAFAKTPDEALEAVNKLIAEGVPAADITAFPNMAQADMLSAIQRGGRIIGEKEFTKILSAVEKQYGISGAELAGLSKALTGASKEARIQRAGELIFNHMKQKKGKLIDPLMTPEALMIYAQRTMRNTILKPAIEGAKDRFRQELAGGQMSDQLTHFTNQYLSMLEGTPSAILDPTSRTSRLLRRARPVLANMWLGWRASTAAINGTGLIITNVLPTLGAKRTVSGMSRATAVAKAIVSGRKTKDVKALVDMGLLSAGGALADISAARGGISGTGATLGRYFFPKAVRPMAAFRYTENIPFHVAALGKLDELQRAGVTYENAIREASEYARKTIPSAQAGELAPFTRSELGRTAFLFKRFALFQMDFLEDLARKDPKKAALGVLYPFVAGGIKTVPFAVVVDAALKQFTGTGLYEALDRAVVDDKSAVAKFIRGGLAASVANIDIGRRLGAAGDVAFWFDTPIIDPIPEFKKLTAALQKDPRVENDATKRRLMQFGRRWIIPLSTMDVTEAAAMAMAANPEREYSELAEQLFNTTSTATTLRRTGISDFTVGEMAARATGFQPFRVSTERELAFEESRP